jgi:hypothetical protein
VSAAGSASTPRTPAPVTAIPTLSERIRWTRVMTAQARLAVGYYDRPDVLEELADAVIEELEQH